MVLYQIFDIDQILNILVFSEGAYFFMRFKFVLCSKGMYKIQSIKITIIF